jgi:anaerobic dimethyl sulfoxide reductase subunit A
VRRIPFTCTLDCGSRCELIACVDDDGRLVRLDTPPDRPDTARFPRLIPCLRGRAHRRLLDAPERVLRPLRRVGPRGAGVFEPVPWDAALDELAERLSRALAEHGPLAILHATGAGSISGRGLSGAPASRRFFSHWAPVTEVSGNMSVHNVSMAQQWMLGSNLSGSDRATLLDSRLILLWGMNPAENHMGPNTAHFVAEARDRGARVVLLDPRYTDSGVLADEWVPMRPGSDAALAAAMAHVMVAEGLADLAFIERCTHGYEPYRRYLLGQDDATPKTPSWAEPITGVAAETIRRLARAYATRRPAALLAGWGPQRTRYGEQSARALMALACLSGNVGLRGGGLGGSGTRGGGKQIVLGQLPAGPHAPGRRLPPGSWAPWILEERLEPAPALLYVVASNLVNRSPDSLANLAALARVPFVVVHEQYMTPTAQHADLVLPINTDLERSDLVTSWGHDSHLFYSRQAVASRGESRTDYWVFAQLAERLGFGPAYTQGRTEQEWLDALLAESPLDSEELRSQGIVRRDPEPRVALAAFRRDPEGHRLPTRSGRIELSSPQAEAHGLPPIPAYIAPEPCPAGYPLQLVTPHHKLRSNSCLDANPWLRRLEPQAVWINPADAAERNVSDGALVLVSAPQGSILAPAYVTARIMPGVVSVAQGTWLALDAAGNDVGGCANTLTDHTLSPTGGPTTHTAWVDVRRPEDA